MAHTPDESIDVVSERPNGGWRDYAGRPYVWIPAAALLAVGLGGGAWAVGTSTNAEPVAIPAPTPSAGTTPAPTAGSASPSASPIVSPTASTGATPSPTAGGQEPSAWRSVYTGIDAWLTQESTETAPMACPADGRPASTTAYLPTRGPSIGGDGAEGLQSVWQTSAGTANAGTADMWAPDGSVVLSTGQLFSAPAGASDQLYGPVDVIGWTAEPGVLVGLWDNRDDGALPSPAPDANLYELRTWDIAAWDTDLIASVAQAAGGSLRSDGQEIAFSGSDMHSRSVTAADYTLRFVDISGDTVRPGVEGLVYPAYQPGGTLVAARGVDSIALLDQGRIVATVPGAENSDWEWNYGYLGDTPQGPVWSPDGAYVAAAVGDDPRTARVVVANANGTVIVRSQAGAVEDFTWSGDSRQVGVLIDGSLHVLTPATGVSTTPLPDADVAALAGSQDGFVMFVDRCGADAGGAIGYELVVVEPPFATGAFVQPPAGNQWVVTDLWTSPDGASLVRGMRGEGVDARGRNSDGLYYINVE